MQYGIGPVGEGIGMIAFGTDEPREGTLQGLSVAEPIHQVPEVVNGPMVSPLPFERGMEPVQAPTPVQLVAPELSHVATAVCPMSNELGLMARMTTGGLPLAGPDEISVVCGPLFAEHAASSTVSSSPANAFRDWFLVNINSSPSRLFIAQSLAVLRGG